jgi:hypothetical protein
MHQSNELEILKLFDGFLEAAIKKWRPKPFTTDLSLDGLVAAGTRLP